VYVNGPVKFVVAGLPVFASLKVVDVYVGVSVSSVVVTEVVLSDNAKEVDV
jgi:hypothetical protein